MRVRCGLRPADIGRPVPSSDVNDGTSAHVRYSRDRLAGWASPHSRSRAQAARPERAHRASRARWRRHLDERGGNGRPGASAALGDRPHGARRAAHARRGRLRDRLQRRDLQLPRAARRSGRPLALPVANRHGGAAGRTRGLGGGLPRQVARHVRLRDLQGRRAAGRARPVRHQAVLLCGTGWRTLFRIGVQGAAALPTRYRDRSRSAGRISPVSVPDRGTDRSSNTSRRCRPVTCCACGRAA